MMILKTIFRLFNYIFLSGKKNYVFYSRGPNGPIFSPLTPVSLFPLYLFSRYLDAIGLTPLVLLFY